MHEIDKKFNIPSIIGECTFLKIDSTFEQNTIAFWNYLDSHFSFRIYLNVFKNRKLKIMYNFHRD